MDVIRPDSLRRPVAGRSHRATFGNPIWVPVLARFWLGRGTLMFPDPLRRGGYSNYYCRCCGGESIGAAEADSVGLLIIRRTSTRRFLARPAALVFWATGLSLPNPIRKIRNGGTSYFWARYRMTASA